MKNSQATDRRIPALQRSPSKLWIVRHGESAGNVARDAAHAGGLPDIQLETRDVDVPLSPRGEQQSRALGRWFSAMPADARPEVVFTSPYLRARATAKLVEQASGFAPDHVIELHGNTTYAKCIGCGRSYDLAWVKKRFDAAGGASPGRRSRSAPARRASVAAAAESPSCGSSSARTPSFARC